jgi:hypothetical protein
MSLEFLSGAHMVRLASRKWSQSVLKSTSVYRSICHALRYVRSTRERELARAKEFTSWVTGLAVGADTLRPVSRPNLLENRSNLLRRVQA